MLHWVSLIIFFVLSVISLWLAKTFLEKNGYYFFCIVASIVAGYFSSVSIFGKSVSVQMVILPVIFLAMLLCYKKYGNKESIRLFCIVIFSQIAMFVLRFFEFALLDIFNEEMKYMSWEFLNSFVATIIAFAVVCIGAYFFLQYVHFKKIHQIFKTSIYIYIFSLINSLIFVIVTCAGYLSFVDGLLTYLIYFCVDIVVSLLLGCFGFLLEGELDDDSSSKPKTESNLQKSTTSTTQTNQTQKTEKKSLFSFGKNDKDKKTETNKSSTQNKPMPSKQGSTNNSTSIKK